MQLLRWLHWRLPSLGSLRLRNHLGLLQVLECQPRRELLYMQFWFLGKGGKRQCSLEDSQLMLLRGYCRTFLFSVIDARVLTGFSGVDGQYR